MSAHAHSANDTTILQDGDQFVDLDAGFEMAFENDDVTHVIRSHPWACYGLHVRQKVISTALGIALNFRDCFHGYTIRKEGARIAPHYRHDDILLCAPTNYCSISNAPNANAHENRNHFEQGVKVVTSSSALLTARAAGAICGFIVVGAHHHFGIIGSFLGFWLLLFINDRLAASVLAHNVFAGWTLGPPTIFVLQKVLGFKIVCIGTASLFLIYGASEWQQKRSDREKQILEVLLQISNATCQSH